jgi:rubrerythrin
MSHDHKGNGIMRMPWAGHEILKLAIEIEKKGQAFYTKVADSMKKPAIREIFLRLAQEEATHEKQFSRMLSDVESTKPVSPYDLSEMVMFFRSLIDGKVFPSGKESTFLNKNLDDPETVLDIALGFEKDTILFLHEYLPLTSPKDQKIIEWVIEEEREHIWRILQLKENLRR